MEPSRQEQQMRREVPPPLAQPPGLPSERGTLTPWSLPGRNTAASWIRDPSWAFTVTP